LKLKTLIVIGTLFALSMAFIPLNVRSGTYFNDLVNLAHFPLLALTTVALFLILERLPASRQWQLSLAAVGAFGIAVAIEIIQPAFGRTQSRGDLRVGLLGIFAASAGLEMWRGPRRRWLQVCYVLAICAAGAVALRPIYNTWHERRLEERLGPHYPLFDSFEMDHELNRWRIHGTEVRVGKIAMVSRNASDGKRSLFVETPGHAWNSAGYEVLHRDWHAAGGFAFDLFVTDNLAKIELQIQDNNDKRFRRWIPVKRGWNAVRIPLTEIRLPKEGPLNFHDIRYLTVSVPDGDDAHTYYIDNVRLIVDTAP